MLQIMANQSMARVKQLARMYVESYLPETKGLLQVVTWAARWTDADSSYYAISPPCQRGGGIAQSVASLSATQSVLVGVRYDPFQKGGTLSLCY